MQNPAGVGHPMAIEVAFVLTGFSNFPGCPTNPTEKLVSRLEQELKQRTARLVSLQFAQLIWTMSLGPLILSTRTGHVSKTSTLCNTNYLTLLSIGRCFRRGKRNSLQSSHSFCWICGLLAERDGNWQRAFAGPTHNLGKFHRFWPLTKLQAGGVRSYPDTAISCKLVVFTQTSQTL